MAKYRVSFVTPGRSAKPFTNTAGLPGLKVLYMIIFSFYRTKSHPVTGSSSKDLITSNLCFNSVDRLNSLTSDKFLEPYK